MRFAALCVDYRLTLSLETSPSRNKATQGKASPPSQAPDRVRAPHQPVEESELKQFRYPTQAVRRSGSASLPFRAKPAHTAQSATALRATPPKSEWGPFRYGTPTVAEPTRFRWGAAHKHCLFRPQPENNPTRVARPSPRGGGYRAAHQHRSFNTEDAEIAEEGINPQSKSRSRGSVSEASAVDRTLCVLASLREPISHRHPSG